MSKEKANERINKSSSPVGNDSKSRKWLILLVIVIVCVLGGIILYLLLGKDAEPEFNRVVTPDNIDEVLSQIADSDKTPMGSYEVRMSENWEFENGNAVSTNAYVANPANNQNTVYFTIARADDGSEIYKSPYLEVGSSLEKIKLDTALKAGKYDTVLTYHLVSDKKEELSRLSVALTITIKN